MKKVTGTILRFLILIIVVLLMFFGLRAYFSNREVVTYTAPLSPVRTVKPVLSSIGKEVTFSGYIESEKMVPIVPFVSGTILEYSIDQGSAVEKDEVVARIDSEPYRLQVAQAEAQATVYESAYERVKNLYEANAATLQEFEGVEAQRNAANAQLELAQLQLSYADVKAPADGTVVINKGTVGSVATNTDFLAVIADMDNLIVNLSVSASYYDLIVDNLDTLDITVRDTSRGIESKASVVSYAPYIDPLSRNFNLKIKLENPEKFTLGSSVQVTVIYENAENIYTLPSNVLRLDGTLYYVEDGKARLLSYEPETMNDDFFEAPSGMEDALFIIEGQNSLFDGQSVNVLEDSGENI